MWNSIKPESYRWHDEHCLINAPLVLILLPIFFAALFMSDMGQIRAFACTPPPGGLPDYSAADRALAAEIVLEGTIIEGSTDPGWPENLPTVVAVEVAQYLKGSGPGTVTIRGFGPTSVCLTPVQIGDHKIFYATGDPEVELEAHYLSQFDAAESVNPEALAEIRAVVDQDSYRPGVGATTSPLALGASEEEAGRPVWWPLVWVAGGALLLLVLLAALYYTRRGR